MNLTIQQLKTAAPKGDPAVIAAIATQSAAVFAKYGISNRNRLIGLMSVVLEETGYLTVFAENMNYTAERLVQVWPTRFPTIAAAAPYAHNPEALADKVYGSRADLGNTQPGDGWLYRGHGLIQATGRASFATIEKATGLPVVAQPEIVMDPAHMLECAVALFVSYPAILSYCDKGNWTAVWALVGSGRANGKVINPANHLAALRTISFAIPLAADTPPPDAPPSAPPAPQIPWWQSAWVALGEFLKRAS